MTQNRIFHAGDSPMAAVYNEAALRSHLEGLFAVGAIHGASDQDAVEGAITKLIAHPYKLFRFGLLTVEFRPDQQSEKVPAKVRYAPVVVVPYGATHLSKYGQYFRVPPLGHEDGTWGLWEAGEWVTTEATSTLPDYQLVAVVAEPITYTKTEQAYIDAAREQFHRDGDLETDDYPLVSLSDEGGAYVQMWKWVPDHLVDLPEEADDAQE